MKSAGDWTVRQVAEDMKVHPETVRIWLRAGLFPAAYKTPRGHGWRIPQSDVDALRAGQTLQRTTDRLEAT